MWLQVGLGVVPLPRFAAEEHKIEDLNSPPPNLFISGGSFTGLPRPKPFSRPAGLPDH